MRRSPAIAALTAVMAAAMSCTSGEEIVSEPAPAPEPISDAAPYICRLVPEKAFHMVSGVDTSLAERTTGADNSGECRTADPSPHVLQVGWIETDSGTSQAHLDFLLEDRRRVYTRHGGVALPASLGEGMAAYLTNNLPAEQPYRVSAKFTCGGKDRLVDIYLAQVAKGRDAVNDLIDLMRIAQKRYAHLHNCDLTP